MKKLFLIILTVCAFKLSGYAQTYSIVIKGGHVIDPVNNINEVMDIAISGDKIVRVAKNIDPKSARQLVEAAGLYVTPGLIDIHSHNFHGIRAGDPVPDGFTFRTGITTTVDAGSSGRKSFPRFKAETIDRSETRVLAWLNIVGEGYKGGAFEQDNNDMDSKLTGEFAIKNKEYIVGIKTAHYNRPDWVAVDRAVGAGKVANIPVMVDFGGTVPAHSLEELFFKHLRPGDVFTHCFAELGASRESIVDPKTKKIKPFVVEAQKRGILFDVGFGGISFAYSQAIPALEQGFYPNSISTDMNKGATNGAMKNILDVMSKFIAMGMDLPAVVKATTQNPAEQINRSDLGTLSAGSIADIAIFNMREGRFGFWDYTGHKMNANKKLECELTMRAGKIVYNLNGITNPVVVTTRRGQNP
ncbi:amidohydrolase/deacetylase family metallohydrolase [Daejeonella sp. JGW-45]|uniref:amidohydrolase/deacetylase family metallohydrolase n=1 Tax=Daejeonella sp. JGW-45 TaxID=3034148 RepID=UPI0023ED575C|nr:amidohydrolase/deacetylase family metallohydrolase [Daejeonella sp. JGW-45]